MVASNNDYIIDHTHCNRSITFPTPHVVQLGRNLLEVHHRSHQSGQKS